MYRKIICGHDGSEGGDDALALADVIRRATSADLTVVGVFPDGPFVDSEQKFSYARRVEAAAGRIGAEADAFPSSSPARGLHDAAEELGADLIVVGSKRKTSPGHVSAGHVGLQLLHGSPCAVAVAPAGIREGDRSLHRIGVALDGSPESKLAQRAAVDLARATGAELLLVSVLTLETSAFGWGYGVYDLEEDMREIVQQRLHDAAAAVPEGIKVHTELMARGAVPALIEKAAARTDLLFLGSRGYGPIRRVLLGSVSAPLVKRCPCPVVVVPRGVQSRRTEDSAVAAAGHVR